MLKSPEHFCENSTHAHAIPGTECCGAQTFDIAVKGCVVIIAARCEGEEIFARFGRAVAKELDLDIAQRCVQGDRHAAGGV